MRNLLNAAVILAMTATAATSGGFAEPAMEPEVVAEPMMEPATVAEEAAAGSGGYLVPLLLLTVIAIAVSSSGSSSPVMTAAPKK
ncbi:MAG: hypothetical protein HKN27_16250 [Silicimonas sp.]|nr:hypothetical protein [Silicimonas sp.]